MADFFRKIFRPQIETATSIRALEQELFLRHPEFGASYKIGDNVSVMPVFQAGLVGLYQVRFYGQSPTTTLYKAMQEGKVDITMEDIHKGSINNRSSQNLLVPQGTMIRARDGYQTRIVSTTSVIPPHTEQVVGTFQCANKSASGAGTQLEISEPLIAFPSARRHVGDQTGFWNYMENVGTPEGLMNITGRQDAAKLMAAGELEKLTSGYMAELRAIPTKNKHGVPISGLCTVFYDPTTKDVHLFYESFGSGSLFDSERIPLLRSLAVQEAINQQHTSTSQIGDGRYTARTLTTMLEEGRNLDELSSADYGIQIARNGGPLSKSIHTEAHAKLR